MVIKIFMSLVFLACAINFATLAFFFFKEMIWPTPYGIFNGLDGRLFSLGFMMVTGLAATLLMGFIFWIWIYE